MRHATMLLRLLLNARSVCVRRLVHQPIMALSESKSGVGLVVLSGPNAPELQELTRLPSGMQLLGTGRPEIELRGTWGVI